MKLLTELIKKNLRERPRPNGPQSIDNVVCKFFDPCGSWTWYVTEGTEEPEGDWLFYGLVDGFEKEWGYFRLSELESVTNAFGLGIERDIHFKPYTVLKEFTTCS